MLFILNLKSVLLSFLSQGHKLINSFGPSDDISLIQPLKKKTSPMCVIWWETMQSRHICITGSEVGEVTFFDLKDKKEITTIYVSGCTEHLLLAHLPDRSTHLLVSRKVRVESLVVCSVHQLV